MKKNISVENCRLLSLNRGGEKRRYLKGEDEARRGLKINKNRTNTHAYSSEVIKPFLKKDKAYLDWANLSFWKTQILFLAKKLQTEKLKSVASLTQHYRHGQDVTRQVRGDPVRIELTI